MTNLKIFRRELNFAWLKASTQIEHHIIYHYTQCYYLIYIGHEGNVYLMKDIAKFMTAKL